MQASFSVTSETPLGETLRCVQNQQHHFCQPFERVFLTAEGALHILEFSYTHAQIRAHGLNRDVIRHYPTHDGLNSRYRKWIPYGNVCVCLHQFSPRMNRSLA